MDPVINVKDVINAYKLHSNKCHAKFVKNKKKNTNRKKNITFIDIIGIIMAINLQIIDFRFNLTIFYRGNAIETKINTKTQKKPSTIR